MVPGETSKRRAISGVLKRTARARISATCAVISLFVMPQLLE
jgi:hypothetical protein